MIRNPVELLRAVCNETASCGLFACVNENKKTWRAVSTDLRKIYSPSGIVYIRAPRGADIRPDFASVRMGTNA